MNPINKPLFFGLYLIAKVFALFFLLGPLTWSMGDFQQGDLLFLMVSNFFDILAFVVLAVLIYKMWIAIPSNIGRTTPEKAVGYLFIPIFNLYWWFQALWGWSQDWNYYTTKSKIKLAQIPEALPITIAIFFFIMGSVGMLLSFFGEQWIAAILSIPNCILVPIFIFKVCDILNNAPASQQENRVGLNSMIFGILSIILPYLGLICGITAIVLAEKQRKVFREPLSKTGLTTGIIGTVFWGLLTIVFLIMVIVG